jgi:predicted acylesterase/phospholipase RssA
MNHPTTAVILSGGGAYGAYEVGVMKALFNGESPATGDEPLSADVFTGTSVGGFNASVMSMQPEVGFPDTVAYLEQVWEQEIAGRTGRCGNGVLRVRGNPTTYVDPACLLRDPTAPFFQFAADAAFFADYWLRHSATFLLSSGSPSQRAAQFVDFSAFISIEPFLHLIERTVRFSGIRESPLQLRVVATNWQTGDAEVFANQDLTDEKGSRIIQASAAIPGLFPTVDIDGVVYVDGGVVMNTPLNMAIQAGATTLHVIYMDPDPENIPLRRLQNTLETFDRLYTIMLATKMNEDIETASWINQGIQAVRRMAHGKVTDSDVGLFVRVAGQIEDRVKAGGKYRELTIHRYHPQDDLGGAVGMLDFSESAVQRLINRGFSDAAHHDCHAAKCLLPS